MKGLSSSDSDSLGASAMIPMCLSADEKGCSGGVSAYGRGGFQSILDGLEEEDSLEESGHVAEKKRRLSIEQVKALEKNFEVENKLEPERKVKLAQELGLQPRQVAVWFQNRRARWKTKQLERDYGALKANYEALKASFESLHRDREALLSELSELKSKLQDDKSEVNHPIKDEEIEIFPSESENKADDENQMDPYGGGGGTGGGISFGDTKDGSSDSDSSAILNDDKSPNRGAISSEALDPSPAAAYPPVVSSALRCGYSSSYGNTPLLGFCYLQGKPSQQFPRIEESSFLNGEDAYDFFAEEQAPTLHW